MIEKFKEVESFWGEKIPMMAMEEMAELIQAVSKMERHRDMEYVPDPKLDFLKTQITQELGDVYISCMALMIRYNIIESEVADYIRTKLDKRY